MLPFINYFQGRSHQFFKFFTWRFLRALDEVILVSLVGFEPYQNMVMGQISLGCLKLSSGTQFRSWPMMCSLLCIISCNNELMALLQAMERVIMILLAEDVTISCDWPWKWLLFASKMADAPGKYFWFADKIRKSWAGSLVIADVSSDLVYLSL